jgi:hypothetical protein
MRRLVGAWSEDIPPGEAAAVAMRVLGKATAVRARDTYLRAFRPRFTNGDPPNGWQLVRPLEDANAPIEVVRPIYYWLTARAERPLYEFATTELHNIWKSSARTITAEEVVLWLSGRLKNEGKQWTPTTRRKVARGMLAALRDFGLLEGRVKKRMVPYYAPLASIAWVARALDSMQSHGHTLVAHRDWALFLMSEHDVEKRLLEAHQRGWLNYQAAGRVVRIEFPAHNARDYANVILA